MFNNDVSSLFFGDTNPANDAMSYYNQIADMMKPYYQPYIDSGNKNLAWHDAATEQLLTNPTGVYNMLGSGYTQSPGYEYNLQQQQQAAKNVSAASGQAGSPAEEQWMMQQASGLAAQDYDNYMNQMMGLYGMGYGGASDFAHMGYQASNDLATNLAGAMMNQGNLAYAGQANQNSMNAGLFKTIAALSGAKF